MNVMNRLTTRSLKLNWRRTIITVIAIMLSVAMITAIAGFIVSFQDVNRRMILDEGGDWHIKYHNITQEQADEIKANPIFKDPYVDELESGIFSLSLKFVEPTRELYEQGDAIAADIGIERDYVQYNDRLLRAEGIIQSDILNDALYQFAGILIAIVMIGSIVVISNAFYISASERSKQFGMMKSVGATKGQVRNSVVFEGLSLAIIGIPLGLLLGYVIEVVALLVANNYLNDMIGGYTLEPIVSWMAMVIAAAISITTVLLSALFPAVRTARVSVIDSIRQSGDIKIKRGKVKTSRLTQKLFGFEGTLASKNLKRSKGKYRSTVISLVVSIVLFTTVMSFGQQLEQANNVAYEDIGFNVMANFYPTENLAFDTQSSIADEVIGMEGATTQAIWQEFTTTNLTSDMLEPGMDKLIGLENVDAYLIGVTDEEYKKLAALTGVENPSAILLNDVQGYWQDGQKTNKKQYRMEPGTELGFNKYVYDETTDTEIVKPYMNLTIDGVIDEGAPDYLKSMTDPFGVNIIVNKDIASQFESQGIYFASNAENPTAFVEQLEQFFTEAPGEFYVENVSKIQKMVSDMSALIKLFTYGFIGMLSLIAVTSVIGTISTNINLRKQEFAMLRSVGMTDQGFNRMLNLESFFYGFKALVFGIPLGLILSYMMHNSLSSGLDYSFQIPWLAIAISIAAVMLLTFATMHYARRKQRKLSIIEALRTDNI